MRNKYTKGYLLKKYGFGKNHSFGIIYYDKRPYVKEVFINRYDYNKDYPNILLVSYDDSHMPVYVNVQSIKVIDRAF